MTEVDLPIEHRLEICREKLSNAEKENEKLNCVIEEIKEYLEEGNNTNVFYVRKILRQHGISK